jgi:PAT family beta-lactamase induction signal transducer AmpG
MNLGDSLILGMIDLFYIEKGFSTIDIAALTKLLGLSFAILGGATATYRLKDRTLPSVLFESCLAHSLAHISLLTLCLSGTPLKILLALTVILEHFSGGMKATLLATWIGSLCDRKKYTGSQYALFSSVKAVPFILGASCSGFLIDILSWEYFFILSFILSLPALMLLPKIGGNSVEFSKSCMQNQPMLESQ